MQGEGRYLFLVYPSPSGPQEVSRNYGWISISPPSSSSGRGAESLITSTTSSHLNRLIHHFYYNDNYPLMRYFDMTYYFLPDFHFWHRWLLFLETAFTFAWSALLPFTLCSSMYIIDQLQRWRWICEYHLQVSLYLCILCISFMWRFT